MLPMLSNDVFSVFAYGSIAARGHDVFTTTSGFTQGVFYPWVGARWSEKVCVYGPSTLLAAMPAALAGDSPWLALVLLRVAWFVPLAWVMELSFRSLRDRPFFHAMVWLNPLWLVQGPGQLHADLLGVVAVTGGILLQRRGSVKAGWVSFSVAVLGKYSFAFTGFWFWLSGTKTLAQRLLRIPTMAAVLVAVGTLLYAPFWRGPSTLTEPVRTLAGMNPGGTLTEVAGYVVQILRGGGVPSPDAPVLEAVAIERSTQASTWFVVSLVMRLIALVHRACASCACHASKASATTRTRARARHGHPRRRGAYACEPPFPGLVSSCVLPFFGQACTKAWRRWWVAIVAVSVSMEFIHVLARASLLLPVWGGLTTAALMVVFLMSFKQRFWSFDAAP